MVEARRSERGYLTVPELAARWGVSLPSAYNVVHAEGFPVLKVGRCLRVPVDRLTEWEREQIEEARS